MKTVLDLDYEGEVEHKRIQMPVTVGDAMKQRFRSPIVLFTADAGPYDGEKSYNSELKDKLTLRTVVTKDPTVRWEEFNVVQEREFQLPAAINNSVTTITLPEATAALIRVDSVLHFEAANENMKVTAKAAPSGGNVDLTVRRGLGTVDVAGNLVPSGVTTNSGVAHLINAKFRVLATGKQNLSTRGEERKYNSMTTRTAVTQIMRTDLSWSRRRQVQSKKSATKQTTIEQRKLQEIFYFMEDAEHTFLFGKMERDSLGRVDATGNSYATGATGETRTTLSDGIFNVIETYAADNVIAATSIGVAASPALNYSLLGQYAKFLDNKVGNTEKMCHLCSADVFQKLGDVGQDRTGINYDIPFVGRKDGITGQHVKTIQTQFGDLTFIYHPMLNWGRYNTMILSLFTDRHAILTLEDGAPKWIGDGRTGTLENGADGKGEMYIADWGLLMSYAAEAFMLTGLDLS